MSWLVIAWRIVMAERDQAQIDEQFMYRALELAAQGQQLGEVPVGAVIVCNDQVIGEGFNQPINAHDPTAHAEIVAIRSAALHLNNYRILESTLYVTLEPCTMCVGALIHSRIKRLVYGTSEPKAGVIVSQAQLLTASYFNHRIEVTGGVLADHCQHQLSDFFRQRREAHKLNKNNLSVT